MMGPELLLLRHRRRAAESHGWTCGESVRPRRKCCRIPLVSDAGQRELVKMLENRTSDAHQQIEASGLPVAELSPLQYANPQCLSPVSKSFDGWIELELTADTGACDTVVPREGPLSHISIVPSVQSERGLLYEVANNQTIPNLGERRLEMWTDKGVAPRLMAVQVVDVHKALLSSSRCAGAGFESRFGQLAGCLIDSMTGEIIPLERLGNLYYLKTWVRQAPIDSPFGGQR